MPASPPTITREPAAEKFSPLRRILRLPTDMQAPAALRATPMIRTTLASITSRKVPGDTQPRIRGRWTSLTREP